VTHPAGYPNDHAGFLEQPTPNGDHQNGQAVERRRRAELTPAERVQQKRNRRLLLTIAIPAVLIGIAALVASILADAGTAGPHPRFVPPGYHGVTDGVFSYAVPNSWSKNDAYSDDAGDLETSGLSGWVGDHLSARSTAPAAGDAPPPVFESFGIARPTPFTVGSPTRIQVRGTTVAYQYTISRPRGFTATAIDAWQPSSGAELWLMIDADPQVTAEIISTLTT
jgi:hypothetical protein